MILKCLRGEPIPVYGKGENIRDWLYVTDHAEALYTVVTKGRVGETYNIGGNNERQNIELVRTLCRLMDELQIGDGNSRFHEDAGYAKVQLISRLLHLRDQAARLTKVLPGFDHFRNRPPRPRHALRDRPDQDQRRARLGAERRLRQRLPQNGKVVFRQPRVDGSHFKRRLSSWID